MTFFVEAPAHFAVGAARAGEAARYGTMRSFVRSYRWAPVEDMRTTVILDKDTDRRLERFARRRKVRNRSEAIRLAIREAERRLDIEEILTRTGSFHLRYTNDHLESIGIRRGRNARSR